MPRAAKKENLPPEPELDEDDEDDEEPPVKRRSGGTRSITLTESAFERLLSGYNGRNRDNDTGKRKSATRKTEEDDGDDSERERPKRERPNRKHPFLG